MFDDNKTLFVMVNSLGGCLSASSLASGAVNSSISNALRCGLDSDSADVGTGPSSTKE
jgi:hypothetical protein